MTERFSLLKSSHKITYLGIFVCATLLFFAWRSPFPLFWDDAPIVAENQFDHSWVEPPSRIGWGKVISQSFDRGFSRLTPSGYRPLSEMLRTVGISYFSNSQVSSFPWYLFIAILYGLSALCLYRVASQFIESFWYCILALFLFFASAPHLCASWVVFAGVQILVTLFICLILILYWEIKDGQTSKAYGWKITFLALALFLAPWVREFTLIGSFLILFSELFLERRVTLISILSAAALFHGFFPTLIVKAFFYPELPVVTVFKMGSLGGSLQWLSLKWEIFQILLQLIPSPLFLLALFSAGVSLWRMKKTVPYFDRSLLLVVWFLMAFLPFLSLYAAQVHLAYALVPLSVLLAVFMERLYKQIGSKYQKLAFCFLLTFGILDHALTLYGSYQVTKAVVAGEEGVAQQLKNQTSNGSVILTNILHGEDIRYLSGGHNDFYYTFASAVNDKKKIVDDSKTLQAFLSKHYRNRPLYFLAGEFEYTPDKINYHSHKFVKNGCVATMPLGVIYETLVRYPVLDPVKCFASRGNVSFLTSPDLENDFYRGPAGNGIPCLREVSTRYVLYRIVDDKVICNVDKNGRSRY